MKEEIESVEQMLSNFDSRFCLIRFQKRNKEEKMRLPPLTHYRLIYHFFLNFSPFIILSLLCIYKPINHTSYPFLIRRLNEVRREIEMHRVNVYAAGLPP